MRWASEKKRPCGSLFALSATSFSFVDVGPEVIATATFPFQSSYQHAPPSLGGSGAYRSPSSSLLCSTPTPYPHRTSLVSSRFGPTNPEASFLQRSLLAPSMAFHCSSPGLLRYPVRPGPFARELDWRDEGLSGFWATLSHAPRATHPAPLPCPRPRNGQTECCLQAPQNLGLLREVRVYFGTGSLTGSHDGLPTHRRSHFGDRRKASFRPAGLGFGRAGFAPAG